MRFYKFIGGIAVILASFWITLMAMDHWDSRRSDRPNGAAQTSRAQAPTGVSIFTLSMTPPNWATANAKTKATVAGSRIVLDSSAASSEYQWVTNPIVSKPDTEYNLAFAIDVTGGRMGIGVEDVATGKWIVTQSIDKPTGTIAFKAKSAGFTVILFGNSAPPTTTSISSLVITGPAAN